VTRKYVRGALIAVVVALLSAPAVCAQGAGGEHARAPSAVAAQMAQDDPRDPFDQNDSGTGVDGGTSADTGTGATAAQGGVASAGTLPLTGSTTTTLLVGVAGLLLVAGGFALWMTRYRPRHAGYRPRHAR